MKEGAASGRALLLNVKSFPLPYYGVYLQISCTAPVDVFAASLLAVVLRGGEAFLREAREAHEGQAEDHVDYRDDDAGRCV